MSDLLLIKAGYGSQANTDLQPIVNGTFRVTSGAELLVDIDDQRLHLGSVVTGYTEQEIKALQVANILAKIYLSSDTNSLFWYNTTTSTWVLVGGDHVALADRATGDALGNTITTTYETKSDASSKKAEVDQDVSALDVRVTAIEEEIGGGGGTGSITDRLEAAEAAIIANDEASINRDDALDDRIDGIDTAYKAADAILQGNIDDLATVVSHINRFNVVIVNDYDELPVVGDKYTIYFVPNENWQVAANMYYEYMWIPDIDPETGEDNGYYEQIDSTSANLDNYYTKTEIDSIVNTIDNTTSAISGRVTAIETELGNHNWKYAGSSTEGGAATKIVETSKDTDAYQDILLANSTHESAEYAASSVAQINPSTGTLKVNAISLGEATLTYDAVSESVVVNY